MGITNAKYPERAGAFVVVELSQIPESAAVRGELPPPVYAFVPKSGVGSNPADGEFAILRFSMIPGKQGGSICIERSKNEFANNKHHQTYGEENRRTNQHLLHALTPKHERVKTTSRRWVPTTVQFRVAAPQWQESEGGN